MLKRIARLYPAYFVAMLLFLLKMAVNFAGENPFKAYRPFDIVGNLLMMTGWGLNIVPVVVDSWSVSTELVCYMLFPILVPFAVPGTLLWRLSAAIFCFFGLLLVVTLGHGINGPLDVVMQNSFYPLVRCISGFTIGLVVFRSWLARSTRRFFGRDLTCALLLVGFLALALAGAPDVMLYACIAPIVLALASGSTVASISTTWRHTRSPRSAPPSTEPAPSSFCCHLTPYLNPIEMAFAKLKTLLRQMPERTIEAL